MVDVSSATLRPLGAPWLGSTLPNCPAYVVVVGAGSSAASAAPLDLSCKRDNPDIHPRSGSCSSTSSTGSGGSGGGDRRQKRKEQNKAAAQNYRQRKKSFSELIESEHEWLSRRNGRLKDRQTALERQIAHIRQLLDDVVKEAKSEPDEEDEEEEEDEAGIVSESVDTGSVSDTMSEPVRPLTGLDLELMPVKRARKYSLPAQLGDLRERKKEQNRLASQRFRQRRKIELSHHETVASGLEAHNHGLKQRCEAMEGKIQLLKEVLGQKQIPLVAPTAPVSIPAARPPVVTVTTSTPLLAVAAAASSLGR